MSFWLLGLLITGLLITGLLVTGLLIAALILLTLSYCAGAVAYGVIRDLISAMLTKFHNPNLLFIYEYLSGKPNAPF